MKLKKFSVVILCILVSCTVLTDEGKKKFFNPDIWVTAYLASWNHFAFPEGDWGNLPTSQIDWDGFTHMIYFTFLPDSTGALSEVRPYENLNESRLTAIVEAAHNNNTPILFTVGGWNTREEFLGAMSDEHRSTFIDNLIQTMNRWGFDGIDINMEPIQEQDRELYIQFINELHVALKAEESPMLSEPLLTAAVDWQPSIFGELQDKFDQINIMTYDMSGAWDGWVTWHNSPLFNGGHTFPDASNRTLPSIEKSVREFLSAGVDRKKLGFGIDFYGYVWEGVSKPLEGWNDGNAPRVLRPGGIPYHSLYDNYNLDDYEWDTDANVPYLSIDEPATFVSFDNERSLRDKIQYARENGLGGIMIWELGGGFRQNAPEEEQDALLQAIKEELRNR